MKTPIKLTEKDLKDMIQECINQINEGWDGAANPDKDKIDFMERMYYRVYNCITRLSDALLGQGFIAGDTLTGPQAAEKVTDEIIRRYGKKNPGGWLNFGKNNDNDEIPAVIKQNNDDDEIPAVLKGDLNEAITKVLKRNFNE